MQEPVQHRVHFSKYHSTHKLIVQDFVVVEMQVGNTQAQVEILHYRQLTTL